MRDQPGCRFAYVRLGSMMFSPSTCEKCRRLNVASASRIISICPSGPSESCAKPEDPSFLAISGSYRYTGPKLTHISRFIFGLARIIAGPASSASDSLTVSLDSDASRSDPSTLERERSWMEQNSDEPAPIGFLAWIDLYDGRLESARQRVGHGVNIAVGSGLPEAAADMLLDLARGEVLYGHGAAATQTLSQALR
jgi:hypothetical protein